MYICMHKHMLYSTLATLPRREMFLCAQCVASYPGSPSLHAINVRMTIELLSSKVMRTFIAHKEGEPGYEATQCVCLCNTAGPLALM